MIQLFRKVLCPIDFSEHSLAAHGEPPNTARDPG